MTESKRRQYTAEYKMKIIERMMPPHNESVSSISEEEGIPKATLFKWRLHARRDGYAAPGNSQTSDKWSSQDKFLIVLETFAMNEQELAEYCRKKGLYREQIMAWREVCLEANSQSTYQTKQLNSALKDEKKRHINDNLKMYKND